MEDEWIVATDAERTLRSMGFSVGVATSVDAARSLMKPGVRLVLLDINLGSGGDGISFAEEIREGAKAGIIFISAHSDARTLERAKRVRPDAFLVKPFLEQQLRVAVELATGDPTLRDAPRDPDAILRRIADVLGEAGILATSGAARRDVPGLALLSAREREVLDALLSNRRAPAIAKLLHISPHTARNHLKAIYQKLGVHSQEELLELLLPPPPSSRVR